MKIKLTLKNDGINFISEYNPFTFFILFNFIIIPVLLFWHILYVVISIIGFPLIISLLRIKDILNKNKSKRIIKDPPYEGKINKSNIRKAVKNIRCARAQKKRKKNEI